MSECDSGEDSYGIYLEPTSNNIENHLDTSTSTIREFNELLKKANAFELDYMFEKMKKFSKVDFIARFHYLGAFYLIDKVCFHLKPETLLNMEYVSMEWFNGIRKSNAWRNVILRHIETDEKWLNHGIIRGWLKYVKDTQYKEKRDSTFYFILYQNIFHDLMILKKNWEEAKFKCRVINCNSVGNKGVYCIQFDMKKIVAGLRDQSIKIWDMESLELLKCMQGHTGSVLCLQYNDDIIISGSSDATIRSWDIRTGQLLDVKSDHSSAVLNLKFINTKLVTCSKDSSIKIWDISNPSNLCKVSTISMHEGAINAVDFDDKYIVSASGDRCLGVYSIQMSCQVAYLDGHDRGIASLHYVYPLAATGSSDRTIRIWNIEAKQCLVTLRDNTDLVRCIRFTKDFLISGAYDGHIRIWNSNNLFDMKNPNYDLKHYVLTKHTGRVFRLQFDDFRLVSSSHDDTIIVWDFLSPVCENSNLWGPMNLESLTNKAEINNMESGFLLPSRL